MQSHVLENLAEAMRRASGAASVWLRLTSDLHDYREPVEVSLGDEPLGPYLVLSLDTGEAIGERQLLDAAGLSNLVDVRTDRSRRLMLLSISISDQLLTASLTGGVGPERRAGERVRYGELMVGFGFDEPAALDAFREKLGDPSDESPRRLDAVVVAAGQLAWELYQARLLATDRVTHLLGPADLSLYLEHACETSRQADEALVLLLISPDDFALVNRLIGRSNADELLGRISRAITEAVRVDDRVFRFGGATLAVVARVTQDGAQKLTANVDRSLRSLPVSAVPDHRLTFSIGGVVSDAGGGPTEDPRDLTLCADQALNHAKSRGGDQTIFFDGEFDPDTASVDNPLGSIFTADTVKDYRNGRILWRTITLVARQTEPHVLATDFARLLSESFAGTRAMVIVRSGRNLELLGSAPEGQVLDTPRQQLSVRACESGKTQHSRNEDQGRDLLAAPLIARGAAFGCLLVDSDVSIDTSDQVFLKALADQVAGAIDQARLASAQAAEEASERQRLSAELRELRAGDATLIAESPRMRELVTYASRIARSDVSVLILGESGTGKEVLARAMHAFSERGDKPMMTVDCSAIAHTLIDSELFGRVKGAFTGADSAHEGRISQAEGSTLFLDEIGELPLDVQAKLLRFVQEKEITAVGSSKARQVDARIICATNRDLEEEVRAGRFREDLYYRLQVVQIAIPPLREREEDIRPLTSHFLARFTEQFDVPDRHFTDAALHKIETHHWPGNVRELQNAILRCVLSVEGDAMDARDLQLGEELRPTATTPTRAAPDGTGPEGTWSALRSVIGEQVGAAQDACIAPLGRWLIEDLVLCAAAADGSTRSSAARLGMAETTFRRQLARARQNAENIYNSRSPGWKDVTALLERVVQLPQVSGEALVDSCQRLLLEEVAAAVDHDKVGAALMDLSLPTYRRRLERNGIAA